MQPLPDPETIFWERAFELAKSATRTLDFGAGRGAHGIDLRLLCGSVDGCDMDPVVASNPFLHRHAVLRRGVPLPYPDGHFDLILSRYVLEHVDDAHFVASEIKRVLAPGGAFLALTPNKFSYVAVAASLVPNTLHTHVLRFVQPEKPPEDTFPTRYRMNTRQALERLFGPLSFFTRESGRSAYDFGVPAVATAFTALHRMMPSVLQTAIVFRYDAPSANHAEQGFLRQGSDEIG